MKIYIGEKGLKQSWQDSFPKIVKCHKCGSEARIMFVGQEHYPEDKGKFICELRKNGGEGAYWVHDAIAVAVYLCKKCFEPNIILNQA